MTAIENLVETALYGALTGDAQLTALATGGVHDTVAQSGPTDNYVIFMHTAGGDLNDEPRRTVEPIYRIEFISTSQANARVGAGHIDRVLHNQELIIAGWSNWRLIAEGLVNLAEMVEGVWYYRKGAFYRISVSINS